jgi:spore coat polysaccharide biosynthesis protein SpsF
MEGSMSVVAIIQARMGATRLPNKVLADICGKTLIERVIERTRAARSIDAVIVATTTESADDVLAGFLESRRLCPVFRGSMADVLDRYYQSAKSAGAGTIVRVTADDPLKDPQLMDHAVGELAADPALDYCSNTLEPTYPEGLDIEAFRFAALERAWREARQPSEREHVTPFIWKRADTFKLRNFRNDRDLSAWRWTVDKPADLEFMRAVFQEFPGQPLVRYQDVIRLLEANPHIPGINSGTARNEGYLKSLQSETQK